MGHFHAIPDVVAVAGDRLVAIVRVDVDGSVVVRDLANCALSTTAASELSAPPALLDPTVAPVLSIVQATDTQWERAQRREAVIAGLASANNLGDQLTRASARLGISRRSVFRWLAAYRDIPQTLCLLAHPRGTPAGARRIDVCLEDLIAEVIRDVYLTKVCAKKEDVVRQVGLRCESEKLTPPSRKAILARVSALDTREVAKARLQRSEAAALVDPVPGTYRVDNALDVVQIDHAPIDVIVVDEAHRMPIGIRPAVACRAGCSTVTAISARRWLSTSSSETTPTSATNLARSSLGRFFDCRCRPNPTMASSMRRSSKASGARPLLAQRWSDGSDHDATGSGGRVGDPLENRVHQLGFA